MQAYFQLSDWLVRTPAVSPTTDSPQITPCNPFVPFHMDAEHRNIARICTFMHVTLSESKRVKG